MNHPRIDELVFYRKRREPALGIVISRGTVKVSLFCEDGKRYDVDPKKIVLLSGITIPSTMNDSERKLEMKKRRRDLEEGKEQIDVETLWECFLDGQSIVNFEDLLTLYSEEDIDPWQRALFFWAVDKNSVYLERAENGYLIRSPDEVSQTLQTEELKRRKKERTRVAADWVRSVLSGGTVPEVDERYCEFLELVERYAIDPDGYERAKEAKSFLSETGIKEISGAVEFLIKIGFWEKYDDCESKKIAFCFRRTARSAEETENILKAEQNFTGLVDRTDLRVFSVDSETTRDFDDAVSIEQKGERITLGVHISNVAHVVEQGSFLDKGCLDRVETVYFPEGSMDMFPSELVERRLSLSAGSERPALSLFAVFNEKDLTPIDYDFETTVVRVSQNLSYGDATDIFCETQWGRTLIALADSLRRVRVEKGAFIVQLPELKISIGDRDKISLYRDNMNSPAHRVISEFMVLMNRLCGDFFRKNGVPALFRSQTQDIGPEARDIDPRDILFPVKVIKHLKPTFVALTPKIHKSLGVDCYVQTTSPIRRYADVLMQRQLVSWLKGKKILYDESELQDTNTRLSLTTREIKNAQRSRGRYWLIRYIMENGIKGATGYVSSEGYNRFNVYIPEFLIELPLSNTGGRTFRIGEEVSLSLWGMDPLRKKIQATPV